MTENISKLDICSEILENLSAFIDGELTKEQLANIYEHLLKCENCRQSYENLKLAQKAVSNYFKCSTENFVIPEKNYKANIIDKIMFVQRQKKLIYSTAIIAVIAVITYFSMNLIGGNSSPKNNIHKVNFTKNTQKLTKLSEFLPPSPSPVFKEK